MNTLQSELLMATGTITVRTAPEIAEQIDALARATDRSRNWIIEEAIKAYLATQAWQVAGIEQARASLAKGDSVSFDAVVGDLQQKIDRKMKQRRPKARRGVR